MNRVAFVGVTEVLPRDPPWEKGQDRQQRPPPSFGGSRLVVRRRELLRNLTAVTTSPDVERNLLVGGILLSR